MTRTSLSLLALATLLLPSACAATASPSAVPEATMRIPAGQAAQLPPTLRFTDRMGSAQVAELPTAVDVAGAEPLTSPRAGDVAYAPAGQALVVFLADGRGAGGEELLKVGRVTSGLQGLADCVTACPVVVVPAAAP